MLVMRAAIAHVIGDILQSIGVCIAGALIWASP
jgi:Co/Zn/Cd efflux system component